MQFIARPVQLSAFERAIIWQIYRATLSSVGYYTSRTRHVPSNEDKCSIVPTEINYLRLLREKKKRKKRKKRDLSRSLYFWFEVKKKSCSIHPSYSSQNGNRYAPRIHRKKKNKRIGTIVRRKRNDEKEERGEIGGRL